MMKLSHATLPQVFSIAVPYYQQVFSNYTQITHAGANIREPFVFIYVDEKLTIVRYQRGTKSAMVSVQEYNFFGCCHDCDIPPHPVHPQSRLHTALFALNLPHPNSIHIQTLSPLSLSSRALCSICDAYVSAHDALLFLSVSREHR